MTREILTGMIRREVAKLLDAVAERAKALADYYRRSPQDLGNAASDMEDKLDHAIDQYRRAAEHLKKEE